MSCMKLMRLKLKCLNLKKYYVMMCYADALRYKIIAIMENTILGIHIAIIGEVSPDTANEEVTVIKRI